jgi:hypothetical protein
MPTLARRPPYAQPLQYIQAHMCRAAEEGTGKFKRVRTERHRNLELKRGFYGDIFFGHGRSVGKGSLRQWGEGTRLVSKGKVLLRSILAPSAYLCVCIYKYNLP